MLLEKWTRQLVMVKHFGKAQILGICYLILFNPLIYEAFCAAQGNK